MSLLNSNRSVRYLANPRDLPSPSNAGSKNPFEQQALSIPDRFSYKSPEQLVKDIQATINFDSPVQRFLCIHNIAERDLPGIDIALDAAQLRGAVRITFENVINTAILRIMPGPEHERVAGDLCWKIVSKILQIPGHNIEMISSVGATRFLVPGVRSKEGDQGMVPATRVGRDAWPSLMIEVGYWEPINLLHLDAEWWLVNSQGRTRFVIIAKICRDPFSLHIECWMMGPPETGIGDRWISKCVQDFNISANGTVTSCLGSPQLEIHYSCIFDQSPPSAEPIILTISELASFATRLFTLLQ